MTSYMVKFSDMKTELKVNQILVKFTKLIFFRVGGGAGVIIPDALFAQGMKIFELQASQV
jgi:hypothetical protein